MDAHSSTKDMFNIKVDNLNAYTNYTFSIQMISATANQSDARLWSRKVLNSKRTNATIPKHSPSINIGKVCI